ncbi:MAG: DUF1152 domain-containing protein [Deltaproteobacteria bacterium]|nr:DUF1152 domain-containing protein [Deltaproteobacteria bacterium]
MPARVTAPIADSLSAAKRVLLAGCGGGYDVFGAIPLALELEERGVETHLANLSFTYLNGLQGALQESTVPDLYAVPGSAAVWDQYCPEAWLARFLSGKLGIDRPVWGFDKTGVMPLRRAYQHLISKLGIDALVLVDGGIDAVLKGNESALGTPEEDLTSLAAVRPIELPTKILACIGLGAELRDGICHEQAFTRMGELTALGGFLGVSALLASHGAGKRYAEAVEYAFANQQQTRRSHVHEVVLASARGETGLRGEWTWLSPLSSTYFFFDLHAVADSHLFLAHLEGTQNIWDVTARIEALRKDVTVRDRTQIIL